ncbi:GNAT family N-acetyltransferase [Nocardia tengchongensis]|uniref:GNAT family N-acetyltransferase n=1 Tax=Nocardia tengchongensis TaxID=2055889 RepID=UPI00366A0DA1
MLTSAQRVVGQSLTVTVKRPGTLDSDYLWTPFRSDANFEPSWWNEPRYRDDTYQYLEFRLDDTEVARVALGQDSVTDHYATAPPLGDEALEIQLIEVSSALRRRHIATDVVHMIGGANPQRRLLAFSEEADHFWASLDWDRHDHPAGPAFYRPLFIQPEKLAVKPLGDRPSIMDRTRRRPGGGPGRKT